MNDAEIAYQRLLFELDGEEGVQAGQMFGKHCLKVHGKAFAAQHRDRIVFKLTDAAHAAALAQPGALLWDPSGKGRPMKQWVALPVSAKAQFDTYARAALDQARGRSD